MNSIINNTPQTTTLLQETLARYAERDDLGGFRTIGAFLFPDWRAGAASRPPHRHDSNPSFWISKNGAGAWRFKDHVTGREGGLFDFAMLSGMNAYQAGQWFREIDNDSKPALSTTPHPSPASSKRSIATAPLAEPSHSGGTGHGEPRIRFYTMAQLRDYQPDGGIVLAGNCNVMRGEVFVIGGEPGVGKSRAATALAVAGALGEKSPGWLGLPIHRQFRTMIIQTENGRYRLQQECAALDCAAMEEWVRISEPPPFGLTLRNPEFIADIGAALAQFRPDCVILDPWNAAAKDDKQRDYAETFDAICNILPKGADKPALGIVAHTRKPQPNEKRTGGTGLMHLLAGSYVLSSIPRSVFIMVPATGDETDDRVVWFNPKNNNGEHAARTAWRRGAGGFTPVADFDWEEFEHPSTDKVLLTLDHLSEVFDNGAAKLELSEAVKQLAMVADISESHAYKAMGVKGKFAPHIRRDGKILTFVR